MDSKTSLPNEFIPQIRQPEPPAPAVTDEAEDGAVLVYDRAKGRIVAVPDEGFAKRLKEKRAAEEKAAKVKAEADDRRAKDEAELAAKAPAPPATGEEKEAIAMPADLKKTKSRR